MPTLLNLAGAYYPGDKAPMLGESAVGFLAGEEKTIHDASYVTVFSHAQRAYVRQGEWKFMTLDRPFDERNFELYNLAEDPGETTDLSARNYDKLAYVKAVPSSVVLTPASVRLPGFPRAVYCWRAGRCCRPAPGILPGGSGGRH